MQNFSILHLSDLASRQRIYWTHPLSGNHIDEGEFDQSGEYKYEARRHPNVHCFDIADARH